MRPPSRSWWLPVRFDTVVHDLRQLLDGLASSDPAVRDGWAYAELAEGIESGRFDGQWPTIRAAARDHLTSDAVQARTFAPLILAWLVDAGDRDRDAFTAVAAWYPAEQPRDRDTNAQVDHAEVLRGALVDVVSRMTPWLLVPRL